MRALLRTAIDYKLECAFLFEISYLSSVLAQVSGIYLHMHVAVEMRSPN